MTVTIFQLVLGAAGADLSDAISSAIGSLRTVKTTLIPADVASVHDRIYPVESLKQALARMPPEMLGTVGYRNLDYRPSLFDAAFKATGFTMNERGDFLGQIEILDTPDGRKLREMIEEGGVTFRTRGEGELNGNQVVNFTVTGLAAIPKVDDAFGAL